MKPASPTSSSNRGKYETREPQGQIALSVQDLTRLVQESNLPALAGVSNAKVSKLCRKYHSWGLTQPFVPWFAEQITTHQHQRELITADLYKRIEYCDPTGETAACHVDRDHAGQDYRHALRASSRYRPVLG